MVINHLTKQAISHTLHCLTGCAVGEILGMAIGTAFSWHNLPTTALAVVLAFFFGYLFTIVSLRRKDITAGKAVKTAFATDTTSITSMEIIDNAFIWLVPGAINAELNNWLFWWSLIIALIVAFILTVPVNRFMLIRSDSHSMHQH